MKVLTLLTLVWLASVRPATAQTAPVAHPCDMQPSTAAYQVVPGQPFGVAACPAVGDGQITPNIYAVYLDGVMEPWPGALVKGDAPNGAGLYEWRTPKTLVIPTPGTHSLVFSLLTDDYKTEVKAGPIAVIAVADPPKADPCKDVPLVVSVKSWPSPALGKSAAVYFTTSQNVQSSTLVWVPRLALTVTDTRGCSATVTK